MQWLRTQERIYENFGRGIENDAYVDPHCTDQFLALQTDTEDKDTAYSHKILLEEGASIYLGPTSEEK